MKRTPRDYQTFLVCESRRVISLGYRRVVVQGETGCGKSLMVAMYCLAALAKAKRVVILAHKRALVYQMRSDLKEEGIKCGIVMAGAQDRWQEPVQVCSKQTMIARKRRGQCLPEADLVVVDEGDRAMSRWYNDLVEHYHCPIILLTATPCDAHGYGMGNYADYLIVGPKPSRLIEAGVIKPCKVFAPPGPNLKGVKFNANGLPGRQVMARIMKNEVVGDVVSQWQLHAFGRPTICFCQNVRHSIHVRDQFVRAGIPAKHIDAETPDLDSGLGYESQESIFRELETGEISVVCNVGMVDEGKNLPFVSCIILAAVDRSIRRFRQRVGRGKRRTEGGEDYCVVLDHSGASRYLGHPDEDIDWTLDAKRKPLFGKFLPKEKRPITCGNPECCHVYRKALACPVCGWIPDQQEKKGKAHKKFKHGMLIELTPDSENPDGTGRLAMIRQEKEQREWFTALGIAANTGRTFKAAAGIFKGKMGFWPPDDLPYVPKGLDWQKRVGDALPGFLRKGKE